MAAQDLEFLISQYLDGTLPAEQRLAVERRLAEDPAATAQLEAYRKVDELLRVAQPLAAIQWDRLAERISSAVAEQTEPARSYRLPAAWIGAAVALAASLLIYLGVAIHLHHAAEEPSVAILPPTGTAKVTGPSAEDAAGAAVAEVRLDDAPQSETALGAYFHADGVVAQTSHVTIASALPIRGGE